MRSVSPLIALVALVALATLFQVGRVGASSAEAEAALQGGSSVPMQADQVDTLLEIANVWEDLRTMSPGAWIRENLETACNSFGAAYGVVCNDKGQVVQLWLTDPSATSGVLPDALGRLTELNLLSIGGVVLGDLPDSLATLTKLQVLQMPNSQLGGTFPSSWKHMMASLQLFEAHWAFVTGLRSWPSDLFSDSPTPPMQQWIMSGYHFGENQPIPHAFFQLPALQQLVLDDISFDGSIPPFFLDGASKASTEVQHSTTTQSTDKQGDHRDTDGDKTEDQKRLVADATRSTLSLAGDAFGSLGSSVLKRLRITGSSEMPTRLSSRRLPSSWAHLPTSLTSLTLHNLPWHGDFPAALPSRLEHLSLSNFPKLQGTVPSSIIDSPDLLTLDLRWLMSVHGDVPSPTKFETSALRSMTLHGVGFNGTLNASLLSSPSLAMLQISSLIYLPQQPLPSLPNGACPRLEHLELTFSNFVGTIPPFLSEFCTLHVIDFSKNKLNGTIPRKWKSKAIAYFNLEENHLTGTLPPELPASLTSSAEFLVKKNNLTGKLPLEYFTSYRAFRIDGNNLDLCANAEAGLAKNRLNPRDECNIREQRKPQCACSRLQWPDVCDLSRDC